MTRDRRPAAPTLRRAMNAAVIARCTVAERDALHALAARVGCTLSELIRTAMLALLAEKRD